MACGYGMYSSYNTRPKSRAVSNAMIALLFRAR